MVRLFLTLIVFLVIVFFGGLFLFNIGALPPQADTLIFKVESDISPPSSASLPYLEKFEGHWNVTLTPSSPTSDYTTCNEMSGSVDVHNGSFSGVLGVFDNSYNIQATIDQDGTVTGTLTGSAQRNGEISGSINAGNGSGTWSDSLDCGGSVTFTKLSPVVDPVQGYVNSFTGDVEIIRNGQPVRAYPSEDIYAGDEIDIPQGGAAQLVLGIQSQIVSLKGETTYLVPNGSST